jgi:uncharacterized protein YjbJ (UPF0337 family)
MPARRPAMRPREFSGLAMFGLTLLLTGVRRTSRRGRQARRDLKQSRRETAVVSQDRDDLLGQRDAARASTLENGSRGGGPQPMSPPPITPPVRPPPAERPAKGTPMSIASKIAHKAEALKGGAKKTVGRVTGNRRLRGKGHRDQAKGNLKQAEAKIKDTFRRQAGCPADCDWRWVVWSWSGQAERVCRLPKI